MQTASFYFTELQIATKTFVETVGNTHTLFQLI